jgi:hypothetical protein
MSNHAKSQEITIRDRAWWRNKARDLAFFNCFIMPYAWDDKFHDFGKIHYRMCHHIDPQWQSNPQIYLSAHRGSGKTTQLLGYECWWFTWSVVGKRSDSMIYNTATKENAWNMSGDVRHSLLENELLHWVFPELPTRETHYDSLTKNRVQVRHVRLDFSSLETTMVSRHYPNWLNDDLENDINAKTEYTREELKKTWRYQKAILTKIKSKGVGREIEVGTPYHHNGLTWTIRNMPRYSKLEIPCYINRDKSQGVWYDELYTVQDFEAKREEMGSSIFSAQYLLLPLSDEDSLCPESWLRYWDKLPDIRWRTMVVDPGGATPGVSDATGITICDTDENGTIYVVYAEEHFVTPLKMLELIENLKKQFDPDDIRVEKEKSSVTIADIMQHRFSNLGIAFVEHRGRAKGDSKNQINSRIWRLRQWFETKRILFGRNMPQMIDQVITFPQTTTNRDDLIDSLAYHLDIRRIPKRKSKLILPSGREFEPSVEESFENEINAIIKRNSGIEEIRENDSRW